MQVPDYLETLLDQAIEYYEQNDDVGIFEAAETIAHRADHLYSPIRGERRHDNLEVLKDLRDLDCLCADELETYRLPNGDYAEGTIAGITRRSIEEFLIDQLEQHVLDDDAPQV